MLQAASVIGGSDVPALFTPQECHRKNVHEMAFTQLKGVARTQISVVQQKLLVTLRYQHLSFDNCFTTTYQGRLAVVNVQSLVESIIPIT